MGAIRMLRSSQGFSLADVLVATAIGATMAAISVPVAKRTIDSMKLSGATRAVERELQTARLRSVSKNRRILVRLNCPAAGQYRLVEITGVSGTDSDSNRCSESSYPYPGPIDNDPATPRLDGPVRQLDAELTLSGPDLLFTPRGTAMQMQSGSAQPITTPVSVSVSYYSNTSTVTVNGLGKIQIQ